MTNVIMPKGKAKETRLGRPPKQAADQDLRDRILDAAEAQFAKLGYEAVSLREVARQADATSAMIHYYFDSKRKLFDAVFARRAGILNRERLDRLNAYEATAPAPQAEGAIEAFLYPVLIKLQSADEGWHHYLALVAQVASTSEWGGQVMTQSFDPVVQKLIDGLRRAFPMAREEDLYWGYSFLSGALILTLAQTDRIDRLSGGLCRSGDVDQLLPRMIAFAAEGFRRICSGP